MYKFVATLLMLVTFNIYANKVSICDEADLNFVIEKHNSNALSEVNRSDIEFKLNEGLVCTIQNELILDGLSFSLYKPADEKLVYIQVHNGLDGSYQNYGAFVR